MKKVILGIVLGIFIFSLVGVLAEENDTNNVTNGNNQTTICDSDNLDLCTGNSECTDAGGFWYDSVCNAEEEEESENGSGTQVSKTKIRNRTSIKFVPWQKRNESECLEGCKCVGAVMSCPTETGKVITIEAGRSGNIITITIDKTLVDTELELEQERDEERNRTRLKAKLSNGNWKEIKIMPDVASETALRGLRLKVCSEDNNCSIELKEVALKRQKKLVYEIQVQRHSRILWIFRKKMQVQSQVDAETGEIIRVKKPWWAFLASEPEE